MENLTPEEQMIMNQIIASQAGAPAQPGMPPMMGGVPAPSPVPMGMPPMMGVPGMPSTDPNSILMQQQQDQQMLQAQQMQALMLAAESMQGQMMPQAGIPVDAMSAEGAMGGSLENGSAGMM